VKISKLNITNVMLISLQYSGVFFSQVQNSV